MTMGLLVSPPPSDARASKPSTTAGGKKLAIIPALSIARGAVEDQITGCTFFMRVPSLTAKDPICLNPLSVSLPWSSLASPLRTIQMSFNFMGLFSVVVVARIRLAGFRFNRGYHSNRFCKYAECVVYSQHMKKTNLTFHLISLFPDVFSSYLNESILARAQSEKILKFKFYNPRNFVTPTAAQKGKEKPYLRVDDKPYGGGPGMVIQALPIIKAVDNSIKVAKKSKGFKKVLILNTSPSGMQFDNALAKSFIKDISDIIIICGRYEGIDARVKKVFKNIKDVSIGPFVLTGGELPAMVMIDGISRHIQGVLGNIDSLEENRPASSDVYTRPVVFSY